MNQDNKPVGREISLAREAKDLTIEQACQLLKIRPEQMQIIEHDNYGSDHLDTYQIGYIQAYCKLVKLDAQVIINRLEAKGYYLVKPQQCHEAKPIKKRSKTPMILVASATLAYFLLGNKPAEQVSTYQAPVPFNYDEVDTSHE